MSDPDAEAPKSRIKRVGVTGASKPRNEGDAEAPKSKPRQAAEAPAPVSWIDRITKGKRKREDPEADEAGGPRKKGKKQDAGLLGVDNPDDVTYSPKGKEKKREKEKEKEGGKGKKGKERGKEKGDKPKSGEGEGREATKEVFFTCGPYINADVAMFRAFGSQGAKIKPSKVSIFGQTGEGTLEFASHNEALEVIKHDYTVAGRSLKCKLSRGGAGNTAVLFKFSDPLKGNNEDLHSKFSGLKKILWMRGEHTAGQGRMIFDSPAEASSAIEEADMLNLQARKEGSVKIWLKPA